MYFGKMTMGLMFGIAATMLTAAESTLMLDDFQNPKTWGFWQPGARTFSLRNDEAEKWDGHPALRVDMRNGYGLLQHELKIDPRASGLLFRIKGAKETGSGELLVTLLEDNRESFAAKIKFSPEWSMARLDFKAMKLWIYGNAPVENGVLEPEKIRTLKLSPVDKRGVIFYLGRLEAFAAQTELKPLPDPAKRGITGILIPEPDMEANVPPRANFSALPKSCSNVTVRGSTFLRDNQPVFLFGAWEWQEWLLRLLAVDIGYFGADNIYSQYPPKLDDDGRVLVERTPCPWYEAQIYRMVSNGLLLWHEQKANCTGQNNVMKKYLGDAIDAGHFIAYDPFNPLGRQLYDQMFKSWMRYTRKYPVFCYEIFNEAAYSNKHPISQREFRRRMQTKYGDINRANSAWRTSFASFDQVMPPGLIQIKDPKRLDNAAEVELEKRQARAYPNLWADWLNFQEAQFGQVLRELTPVMMRNDRRPGVLATAQSHCSLGWDYGSSGVHPAQIAAAPIDFYSHEDGLAIFPQIDGNDVRQIKRMASLAMTCDVVASQCPDKPVFNAESPLYVSAESRPEEELERSDLAGLSTSPWQFFDASSGAEPDGWNGPHFNASAWAFVKVPEMWGKQGFPHCTVGLYRKQFRLPASAPAILYLNGKEFADQADIYCNGKLLYSTSRFDERICLKLDKLRRGDNFLCVRVRNQYFKDGMYYGGIRGYVAVNAVPALRETVMKAAYVRAHTWLQAVHGMSGNFICYDNTNFQDAIKILPALKAEMATVAPLLLPRPRLQAQVALVYPFETFRVAYPDSYEEYLKAPLNQALLDHYLALLFNGVPFDMISNREIAAGKLDRYRLIVASQNVRVPGPCIEKLRQFVRRGGVLVCDLNSFSRDDASHETLDVAPLLGVKPGPVRAEPRATLNSKQFNLTDAPAVIRRLDGASVCAIQTGPEVEICASFRGSGQPAITRHVSGRGAVYYLAASLPYASLWQIYRRIQEQHGLVPETAVRTTANAPAEFVESQVFSRDNRHLLYALNFGRQGVFRLQWQTAPDGHYSIRHPLSAKTLPAPDGQAYWSAEQLRAGLKLTLDNMDPLLLLIEKAGLAPLPIRGISPLRRAMLTRLWNPLPAPAPNGKTLALVPDFDSLTNTSLPNTCLPTAIELLRLSGYRLLEYSPSMPLTGVDAVLWTSPMQNITDARIRELRNYVENGGSLLLCGNAMVNWHTGIKNGTRKLWDAFELNQGYLKWLSTSRPRPGFDFMQLFCPAVASSSPALHGVNTFVGAFAAPVESRNSARYRTLIAAPADSNYAGAPVLVEGRFGKGKVIAVGDSTWLTPFNLELGDNPQLLYSLTAYLSGRAPATLSPELKNQALYITRAALAEAERQEAQGIYSFEPYSIKEKSIRRDGPRKSTSGYLDPIVDMQN